TAKSSGATAGFCPAVGAGYPLRTAGRASSGTPSDDFAVLLGRTRRSDCIFHSQRNAAPRERNVSLFAHRIATRPCELDAQADRLACSADSSSSRIARLLATSEVRR